MSDYNPTAEEIAKARKVKAFAKAAWIAKVNAIDNLDDVIASAFNERHTPYSELASTPGHEKSGERYANLWGGGKYEYDINFSTTAGNGVEHQWNGTLVVRADKDGKRYLYDIVNLDMGNAESAASRVEYLAKSKKQNEATAGQVNTMWRRRYTPNPDLQRMADLRELSDADRADLRTSSRTERPRTTRRPMPSATSCGAARSPRPSRWRWTRPRSRASATRRMAGASS